MSCGASVVSILCPVSSAGCFLKVMACDVLSVAMFIFYVAFAPFMDGQFSAPSLINHIRQHHEVKLYIFKDIESEFYDI